MAKQVTHCRNCGAPLSAKTRRANRKFCTEACRDDWARTRHQRARENPPEVKVIENFDEYLSGDTMVCPIVGCDWEGQMLGQHCNLIHGVDAAHLRELLGLNRKQSTATQEIGELRSARAKQMSLSKYGRNVRLCGRNSGVVFRAQAIEHAVAVRKNPEVRKKLSNGAKKGWSPARRAAASATFKLRHEKNVEKICQHCGVTYLTSKLQAVRSKYCCPACRRAAYHAASK